MTTYLVTGGAGFIGSALCRRLAERPGTRVVNVDSLAYSGSRGSTRMLDGLGNYRFVHCDIGNEERMRALLAEEAVEVVVHLAAQTHVDRSIVNPASFIETNVVATHSLLEAARWHWERLAGSARDSFRFHHVSTDEVFGSTDSGGDAFTEQTRYAPSSPYSASKAASDHLVRAWHRTYGLPVTVSNCSNNYGPFQHPEKLIPVVILNALHGRPIPIYGDGGNVRDWLYVDDHVDALGRIVARGAVGESYNIGGGCELTNLDLAETICARLDLLRPRAAGRYADLIEFVVDRPGHDRRYAVDSAKIARDLGWSAATSLADGLDRTIRWYLGNEWWWRPLTAVERAAGTPLVAAAE